MSQKFTSLTILCFKKKNDFSYYLSSFPPSIYKIEPCTGELLARQNFPSASLGKWHIHFHILA